MQLSGKGRLSLQPGQAVMTGLPETSTGTEAEGLKVTHGRSWECTGTFMQSPWGQRAGAGADTPTYAREGPPGGMLAGGLLQTSPEAPERGVCLGRGTRVTEHKVFQEKLAPGGSGNFFFLTHQYLTLMKVVKRS